ncbi:dihydrodipicolinate reductase [Candidatus Koribacter versatilis Ellin345]|uniref:4-hydroxy-tetrahydrodipicolinate reductase n=1 Tax=Koribacter versatilis (strain Ellin345) TaxID=204669 RepID=Q1INQ7_KORVE|nr:dihydrodipicolinate reductase C-terminal domain-containing protein [Candidatus Koribacter versatilis]ABF41493.1 dihydrodipicolinate reductase [Candidatus Koribacter versatilis Ellin345]
MNLLLLGCGKTGSLVRDYAIERHHRVRLLDGKENAGGAAITPELAQEFDVAIDFTTPAAVLHNIEACARMKKNIVVGTTGWYDELPRVETLVNQSGIGFVWGANFSFGVNLFFEIAKVAAEALKHGYGGSIEELHHVHKKDAPSGTAANIQQVLEQTGGKKMAIASIREGDIPGTHTILLDSEFDSLTLTHAAKSRRGFAEGAVKAAEWLQGKTGFYDFRDIFHEV